MRHVYLSRRGARLTRRRRLVWDTALTGPAGMQRELVWAWRWEKQHAQFSLASVWPPCTLHFHLAASPPQNSHAAFRFSWTWRETRHSRAGVLRSWVVGKASILTEPAMAFSCRASQFYSDAAREQSAGHSAGRRVMEETPPEKQMVEQLDRIYVHGIDCRG